jgi:hypothetical protein
MRRPVYLPVVATLAVSACGALDANTGSAPVGLRAPLGPRAWLELTARGGVLFADFGGGVGELWTARVGAGAGLAF